MDYLKIIQKYYDADSELYHILITHSQAVRDKALWIAQQHPELSLDLTFIEQSAMVHDIGIFMTDAPSIQCFGKFDYICHGYLGAELITGEGFPHHALVCERHTGAGLSLETIEAQNLPIPKRDMRPQSFEEQIICFADKFFSKSRLDEEKSIDRIRRSLSKFNDVEGLVRFNHWCELFL